MPFVVGLLVVWVCVTLVFLALWVANSRAHARAEKRTAESIRDVQEFREGHRHQRVVSGDARDGGRTTQT